MVYTNAIEAGNKILVNTASLQMFGAKRSPYTRLLKSTQIGDTSINVEPGLDWKAGD
jgi:hypothetical protein